MSKIAVKKSMNRMLDWLSIILLTVLLEVAAARLVATEWTLDLSLVMVITFLGSTLGLALGKSRFNRFWVFILAAAYVIILIPWQLGLTLDAEIKWLDRLVNLWGRLGIVVQELLTRRPVTDNLLFLFLMALLFWVLAVYAGVVLIREKNPWKVIIPTGLAAFVINSFDALLTVRSIYLAFYLLFAMLLVARSVYIKNTSKWVETRTHTPPDIGFDISRVALVLSMVLVLFSWNIPVIADTFKPVADVWHATARPWLNLKDRCSFMFASLQASATTVQNFYSDNLPLGLGSSLTDQIVMEVIAPPNPTSGGRYYWEARSYDTYTDNSWATSILTSHPLTADSKDIKQPGADVRTNVTFTFIPHQTISNIYAVSEPLWTSLPTQAYMLINNDGTVELSALMSKGYVRPGEQYKVRAAIDTVTAKELKDAIRAYPNWITSEYLQLPENITPRTKDLAKKIASGLTNQYDIVNAVTQYLRDNIQYDLSVGHPPVTQERIDWFLFDYQKGYCNYYASAEVILLRSLGIPSRLGVGFAQGEIAPSSTGQLPVGPVQDKIQPNITYIVRQKDAHAWPEVYFPSIGWVIFEPTVSQSPLSRPSGEVAASYDLINTGRGDVTHQELGSASEPPQTNPSALTPAPTSFWTPLNTLLFSVFLLAVGFLAIFVWQMMRGFRLYAFLERISVQVPETIEKSLRRLGLSPPAFLLNWIFYMKLPATSRSYLEINNSLERVGKNPAIYETPSERTAQLVSAIPAAALPAGRLLTEYQASIYSRHPADAELARKAAVELRKLSWRAWLQKVISRFRIHLKRGQQSSSAD